jgi:hypothetical protein
LELNNFQRNQDKEEEEERKVTQSPEEHLNSSRQ